MLTFTDGHDLYFTWAICARIQTLPRLGLIRECHWTEASELRCIRHPRRILSLCVNPHSSITPMPYWLHCCGMCKSMLSLHLSIYICYHGCSSRGLKVTIYLFLLVLLQVLHTSRPSVICVQATCDSDGDLQTETSDPAFHVGDCPSGNPAIPEVWYSRKSPHPENSDCLPLPIQNSDIAPVW